MSVPPELNLFRKRRVPVVFAAESAECGLACLAMIARFHGHDVDLNGLRQRFSVSMAGASLRHLIDWSDRLDLTSRAIRVELDMLRHIPTPAILHWNLQHFVVLVKADRKKIIVHDPAVGRVEMSYAQASNHFTGVALELAPGQNFEPVSARQPVHINQLWSGMRGFWSAMAQVLVLSVLLQVAVFAGPFQLQLVVDEALGRADRDLLLVLALGFGGLVILQGIIDVLRAYSLQVLGHLLSFQMIGNLVRHLMRLKTDFFEKRHVGDIISRIQSTLPIQDAVTQGVVAVLIDGVMAVIALVIMFIYSPLLTVISLLALLVTLLITLSFYPIIRRRTEEQIQTRAQEQTHLLQSIRAAMTIKVMGREAEREGQWRNIFADTVNASFSLGKFQIVQRTLQTVIAGLVTVIIIFLAGRMILAAQGFSVGMLFAYLSFRQTFSDRVIALINQVFQFRLLGLHLERIGDIAHAETDCTEDAVLEPVGEGRIDFCDVSFRYGESDRLVLDQVSLRIEPGDFLAVTGPSGGGKTTLLKLMLGLYAPSSGSIRIDGLPADGVRWRAWRGRVGVVAQDDQLLSGTLADNIAFFDPGLDMDRVKSAAPMAHIHDEIMSMPMGYLSLVGDMGSILSGGQRQRILLARALYRNPDILLLDEGTANLDQDTERNIADLIASLPITRVVVAHRPALIARAKRVVTVFDGRLVESGRQPGRVSAE